MTRFVLASASSGRRKVLRQAGIDPLVIVSGVDEDAAMAALDPSATPSEVTATLALAKAEAVVGILDPAVSADCVVVGCDSMLYRGGELHGKPGTAQAVRHQWHSMADSAGYLLTGHALLRISSGVITHTEAETRSTTIHFGQPTDDDLEAYIADGEPIHVAGAFTLDGLGGWFIDGIEGDPSNVIGLSLPLVRRMIHRAGLSVSALWAVD
ncbi:MAG TPA: nucleoside triphosphate pyrophosphatase [Mycobacterium sp.]